MGKYTQTAIGRLIPLLFEMDIEYTIGPPADEFRALWDEAMLELERVGPVLELMRLHDETWKMEITEYWYARLVEEVGELGSALVGAHDDSPVWELMQVATIALNFLRRRRHTDADMMRELRFRWHLYGPEGLPDEVKEW